MPKPLDKLKAITGAYDAMYWLEADGYIHVLHRVLLDAGIAHTVWTGSFVFQIYSCPLHRWIVVETPMGAVIVDYRVRNWFKLVGIKLTNEQLQAIPHGVFFIEDISSPTEPVQRAMPQGADEQETITYAGTPTEIARLDDAVFSALLEPPPSLEGPRYVQIERLKKA